MKFHEQFHEFTERISPGWRTRLVNNNNNNNTGCYIRAFPKELKARRSIPT
jgi:hypothetical protein